MYISIPILIASCLLSTVNANEAKLEFSYGKLKPWGSVTFQAGQRVELSCTASDADPEGEFVWLMDEEVTASDRPVRVLGDNTFQQNLVIDPTVDLDGAEVECKYVQRDSFGETLHEPSILLGINVVIHEWPTPAQEEFVEGEQAVLSVPLKLYPKPENNEVTWKITDTKGQVTSLNPGHSDAMAHYRASELVEATSSGEDHSYVAKLTIGSVTANDHANQIQLLVVPPGGNKKKPHVIDVNFVLRMKEEDIVTTVQPEENPKSSSPPTEEQRTSNRLGVGVWIVLGIIILVIAIIVGYCIYQKKCGKSEEYQQPNEQKQAEQQQNPV